MNDERVTGGDLFLLWQAANVCLPRTADTFTDVNDELAKTSNGDQAAFTWGGGGGVSAVYAPFANLRNEMQLIVSLTATYLLDAQTALNNAITAYGEQDGQAKRDLENNYLNNPDKHDKNDAGQNPPTGENAPGKPTPPTNYESPADK